MLDVSEIQVGKVESLAFSSAGHLAIAGEDCVWIATVKGGKARVAIGGGEDAVTCVAFDSGNRLAIGTKQTGVRIIELGGTPKVSQIKTECCWHSMQWSPDDKYIVGAEYEPFINVLDVERLAQLRVLDPDEFDDEGHTSMVFANELFVTTAYNKLVRWRWADVIANKPKCRHAKTGMQGHSRLLEVVRLEDGSFMTLVEHEERTRHLQRFAPTGEKMGKKVQVADGVWRMVSDGRSLVLVDPRDAVVETRTVDGQTRWKIDLDDGDINASAISRDGKLLAIGGNKLGVYELATGERLSPR